jgi:hypothetical protein
MTSRFIRLIPVWVLFTVGLSFLASAQELVEKKSFEGIVGYQIRDFQSIESFTLFMKRGRLRLEGTEQGGGNGVLLDYGVKKSYIIISGREQYVELPVVYAPPKGNRAPTKLDVQKTDSTDEIEGYQCDQFLVNVDTLEYEIWATKDFGTAGTFLTPQVSDWMWKILDMGYFPMRFVARDATGEESGRFEVTSVTKKSLTESLFRIPSGYERIDPEALKPQQAPKKRTR